MSFVVDLGRIGFPSPADCHSHGIERDDVARAQAQWTAQMTEHRIGEADKARTPQAQRKRALVARAQAVFVARDDALEAWDVKNVGAYQRDDHMIGINDAAIGALFRLPPESGACAIGKKSAGIEASVCARQREHRASRETSSAGSGCGDFLKEPTCPLP